MKRIISILFLLTAGFNSYGSTDLKTLLNDPGMKKIQDHMSSMDLYLIGIEKVEPIYPCDCEEYKLAFQSVTQKGVELNISVQVKQGKIDLNPDPSRNSPPPEFEFRPLNGKNQ